MPPKIGCPLPVSVVGCNIPPYGDLCESFIEIDNDYDHDNDNEHEGSRLREVSRSIRLVGA